MSTITTLNDNDTSWLMSGAIPRLMERFNNNPTVTYGDVVANSVATNMKTGKTLLDDGGGTDETGMIGWLNAMPDKFKQPTLTNASLGGNDAINCYWQFGEDDDIALPMDKATSNGLGGMGSVYKEVYDQNQQICWVTFGVPKYNSTIGFQTGAVNAKLAGLMNTGSSTWGHELGAFFGAVGTLLISLPFLPLLAGYKGLKTIGDMSDIKITKYYSFKPTMPLYYRMVNTLVSQFAVGMGLYNGGFGESKQANTLGDLYGGDANSLPLALREGPDIYAIMDRRAKLMYAAKDIQAIQSDTLKPGAMRPSDAMAIEATKATTTQSKPTWVEANTGFLVDVARKTMQYVDGAVTKFKQSAVDTAYGGKDFIGFRIEKNVTSSESISNSVGESGIAAKYQSAASAANDKMFDNFKLGDESVLGGAWKGVKDAFGAMSDAAGMSGQISLKVGGAFFDFPQVWKSSNFSKSYTIKLKLEARLHDPVSIFQSQLVPLAVWMAGALPRQVGNASYTSPFILRAYSKGMFSIPLGMITSISIIRGASEFGWTVHGLPTSIVVTINIQDLNPAMYVGMADGGTALTEILEQNDTINEYITTITGVGLADWHYTSARAMRNIKALSLIKRNTTFSALHWGTSLGDTAIARAIVSPFRGLVNND